VRRRHCWPSVARPGDKCAYRSAYRFVSIRCNTLQFVATSIGTSCSTFQFRSVRCSLLSRTFNPKVAGSIPARPISRQSGREHPRFVFRTCKRARERRKYDESPSQRQLSQEENDVDPDERGTFQRAAFTAGSTQGQHPEVGPASGRSAQAPGPLRPAFRTRSRSLLRASTRDWRPVIPGSGKRPTPCARGCSGDSARAGDREVIQPGRLVGLIQPREARFGVAHWTTVCCIAQSAAAARVETPILP
jgi:hypothetical protein